MYAADGSGQERGQASAGRIAVILKQFAPIKMIYASTLPPFGYFKTRLDLLSSS